MGSPRANISSNKYGKHCNKVLKSSLASWVGFWMAWHQRSSWAQPRAWISKSHRHAVLWINSGGHREFQRLCCQVSTIRDTTRALTRSLLFLPRGALLLPSLYDFFAGRYFVKPCSSATSLLNEFFKIFQKFR